MTILHKLILLFLASIFILSCERDNFEDLIIGDPSYDPNTESYNDLIKRIQPLDNNYMQLGCLMIDMPVSFVQKSGNTLQVKNLAEANAAMQLTGDDAIADIVFPLLLDDQYSRFNVINDNKTLATFLANCVPDYGWTESQSNGENLVPAFLLDNYNIKISFPAELTDGIEFYQIENELEFIVINAKHPNLSFTTPFSIEIENGGVFEVTDIESFFNTLFQHTNVVPPYVDGNIPINGFGCNKMQFPMTVKIKDDILITLQDANQYALQILTKDWMEVQYPFDMINQSTGLITVTQISDLLTIQEQCGYNNESIYACNTHAHTLFFLNITPVLCYYTINYPVNILVNGVETEIIKTTDYLSIANSMDKDSIKLVYPISVEVNGMTRTYYSDDDVCMYSKSCN